MATSDLAMYLLERGANPKLATAAGGTPCIGLSTWNGVLKSFYPQPNTKQEKVSYLDLINGAAGAWSRSERQTDRPVVYTPAYGFELEGVEPAGATPFWRAAHVGILTRCAFW